MSRQVSVLNHTTIHKTRNELILTTLGSHTTIAS